MYELELENSRKEIEKKDKLIFEMKSQIKLGDEDENEFQHKQQIMKIQLESDNINSKLNNKLMKQNTLMENQKEVIIEMEQEIEDLNNKVDMLNA